MYLKIKDFFYPFEIIKLKKELNRTEQFTHEQLLDYQNKKLCELIKHSYENIPYYKKLFIKNKINPEKIKNVKDLQNIPVLTKQMLKDNFEDLIYKDKKNGYLEPVKTSGTTGTPLTLYHDKHTRISRFTFLWRMWSWAGYNIGDRWAVIGNSIFEDNKIFKYKKSANALYVSIYKINEANSFKIIDELVKFKCCVLRGYPSALVNMARFVEGYEMLKKLKLKSIITDSEALQKHQRKKIEQVFNVKVYNMYVQSEWAAIGMECGEGNIHHQMENGIIEILDNDNNVLDYGTMGEITATGFYNKTMPLIRYKTGDLAVLKKSNCSCLRAHDVLQSLDGRLDEVIITPEGFRVSALNEAVKNCNGFDFIQIVQNSLSEIDVNIVKNDSFKTADINTLEHNIRRYLNSKIKIKFFFVDEIKPSANGKIRFVVNNIKIDN